MKNKNVKNGQHNFLAPEMPSSHRFACPSNNPKPRDPSLTITSDKETH